MTNALSVSIPIMPIFSLRPTLNSQALLGPFGVRTVSASQQSQQAAIIRTDLVRTRLSARDWAGRPVDRR